MMLTEVLLQGARINPLIYETISTCWIFADELFEANGWLTLYRESEYDDDFEDMANEFWGPELRYLREIFIHFRLGHTGVSQAWLPCFNSPVYNAVQRGYIKVYKLDKGKQFRSSQELSVASHPIWSQHLQSEYAEGSINQLRATLACALSESLDGRWYDRDVENRMLYSHGFGARMKLRVEHTAQAAVTHVSESLQELIEIGIVLFKGVQAGYQAYLELRHDIDEKGAAAITDRMHALGIKIEQSVDKVTALLKQGLSMLNIILSDPYCRGYLFEYFDGLKESISELGRCRMIGGFIGEVGLDFIIAIATRGIGLIPRAAQLIGGLSYKVLKVMLQIYDAVQAKAGQALEASRAAQRRLDVKLNRAIAPKSNTLNVNTGLKQTGGGGYSASADELYDAIRDSDTDVSMIASNTGFKPENIQKVKNHVFYDEHLLDRYVDYGIPAKVGRFDSTIEQANAWKRLENGTYTDLDITWLKHETAERWYEKKYNSGYSEAHNRVDSRWSGFPWEEE